MPLFVWEDGLALNVRELDEQHKRLFAILDRLCRIIQLGQDRTILEEVLHSLIVSAFAHVRTEERYMRQTGYPELNDHKSEHAEFLAQAIDLRERIEQGRITVKLESLNLLADWVRSHILTSDRRFAEYISRPEIQEVAADGV